MQYILDPIAFIIKWSFDYILVPLGELPAIINPNNIFILIGAIGFVYWLYLQGQYNKKAEREGKLK